MREVFYFLLLFPSSQLASAVKIYFYRVHTWPLIFPSAVLKPIISGCCALNILPDQFSCLPHNRLPHNQFQDAQRDTTDNFHQPPAELTRPTSAVSDFCTSDKILYHDKSKPHKLSSAPSTKEKQWRKQQIILFAFLLVSLHLNWMLTLNLKWNKGGREAFPFHTSAGVTNS